MVDTNLLTGLKNDGREARLLSRTVGGDNRPFIERISGNTQKDLSRSLQGFTDPDALREQKLTDTRGKFQAFQNPDIFTVPVQASAAGKGGNKERLISMTPERRLEEFTAFVNGEIPQAVRAKYEFLFSPPLDARDIFDYEQQAQEGRIRIILTALASVYGTKVVPGQNPTADMLALDISAEKNNAADSPGSVFRLYEQWLDSKPGISETDATTPEILLKSNSGIPDRLRGDLQNLINPAVQKTMLIEMYELYRNRSTDDNLTFAQARVDQLQLTGSVEKKRIERESRGLVENFRNADPRLQLVMAGVGAYAVWQILKSKNPLGRWALAGGVGYFAYDRFVNGNENAFNDMAKKGQGVAKNGGNLLKNLARELGVPISRNEKDKLELMAQFITENHLNIPGHEAMTSMSALSGVGLGTIADAFDPHMDGTYLGGNLRIYDNEETGNDATAISLRVALNKQYDGMKINGDERKAHFQYLKDSNGKVSKAILHTFYQLAMDDKSNDVRVAGIEKYEGNYDSMPPKEKQDYMDIALQGKNKASKDFKTKSLVDVVADLTIRRKNKVEKKDDPAVEIPDPKTPGRKAEFALIEDTQNLPLTTTAPVDVLRDSGASESDTIEFLRNCEASGVLNADAALELARRFDKVRRETPDLTEALQMIEKMKYAVLVQSTKQENRLTKDDIILLTGPDDLNVSGIFNRVTGFLGRFAPSLPGRGFGSVASLGDVRSLLNEPWFGTGPVQSKGEGFKRLTDRMNIYDKKMTELKDTNEVAKRMAGALPDSVALSVGGRAKLEEILKTFVPASNYQKRIDHAEQHLSQRMANALARTMRLTHEADGFGRFDDLAVTPIEQKNLTNEFDLLFIDVMGDPLRNMTGMWQRVEDIDTYRKFDMAAIEKVDYTHETKRLELQSYAKDLAILHSIRKMFGTTDDAARQDMGERVLQIRENIAQQKKAVIELKTQRIPTTLSPEIQAQMREKNQFEAQIIENNPSYRVQDFEDLDNALRILEMPNPGPTRTFRNLFEGENIFPPLTAPSLTALNVPNAGLFVPNKGLAVPNSTPVVPTNTAYPVPNSTFPVAGNSTPLVSNSPSSASTITAPAVSNNTAPGVQGNPALNVPGTIGNSPTTLPPGIDIDRTIDPPPLEL